MEAVLGIPGRVFMFSTILRKGLSVFFSTLFLSLTIMSSQAADDVTLTCKKTTTDTAVDLSSLGLTLSAAVPVGTVLYEGTTTVVFKCGMDNLVEYLDGQQGEVYFKRKVVDESDSIGYGLTIYSGYNGDLGTEAASIATGKIISMYAFTSGGTIGEYTDVELTVPFKIVKTSASMTASTALRNYVNVFDVGSYVAGTDLKFYFTNIKSAITVRDETCSVTGDANQTVNLGSYSVSKTSGLGSGIGSTSTTTAFNIDLNCEALLSGSFDVMMQFDGTAVSGLSDSGVLALTDTSNSATNVGVQILDGNSNPISLGTPFTVASFPLSSSTVTVPLYARYYQTGENITAGAANSLATYTISYQ